MHQVEIAATQETASAPQAILFMALGAIGCGLVGTLIGMSFSDSLL